MTPLQVMKLGYLMRQAQKAYLSDKSISAVTLAIELEKQFDEAIMPYMDHAKAIEAQEARYEP